MKPLYVLTSVFNPRRFASRHRLYDEFAGWIDDSGVRLLTVEVSFGGREPVVTRDDDPWHVRLATRNELWHKERALNIGLQHLSRLVPDWRYVAWMDADVRLARPDWAKEAVHLLQHYAVVQLFGHQRFLGPNYEPIFDCPSVVRTMEESGILTRGEHDPGDARVNPINPYLSGGHPGLAWSFRRDELNDVGGWLDICANGSGDSHMANCFAGWWDLGMSPKASPGYRSAIRNYGQRCDHSIRRNISWMPGSIDHYWHGRAHQRGYEDRWKLLVRYQFDPRTDLVPDCQGLWKWNLADPRVRALAVETRKSLAKRNEDTNEA